MGHHISKIPNFKFINARTSEVLKVQTTASELQVFNLRVLITKSANILLHHHTPLNALGTANCSQGTFLVEFQTSVFKQVQIDFFCFSFHDAKSLNSTAVSNTYIWCTVIHNHRIGQHWTGFRTEVRDVVWLCSWFYCPRETIQQHLPNIRCSSAGFLAPKPPEFVNTAHIMNCSPRINICMGKLVIWFNC